MCDGLPRLCLGQHLYREVPPPLEMGEIAALGLGADLLEDAAVLNRVTIEEA